MTSEEKMREEFEAWISERHESCIYTDHGLEKLVSGERYCSMEIEWAWLAWKASRESLVIELPGRNPEYIGDRDHQQWACGCNYGIDRCRESIHAVGVKTK